MDTMTRRESKEWMVAALGKVLERMREDGEYLTGDTILSLRHFVGGPTYSIRLVVQMGKDANESQRCVTLSLVQRSRGGDGLTYLWRVKVETSVWSSRFEATEQALRGWGVCERLAVAALRAADEMPPIVEPVEELVEA